MSQGTRRVTDERPEEPLHVQAGTRRVEQDQPDTRRVEEAGAGGTRRVDEAPTADVPPVRRARLPLGAVAPGSFLCGDCQVLQTLHPHESQRPGLYLCDAPEGRVMVKVAATQHPPKPELWERLRGLQHPNVLRTFRTDVGEHDGFHYEVQEFCSGGTLDDRLGASRTPLTQEWVMQVMLPQIHLGLKYLHDHDLIHRDIKPANVYIKQTPAQETLILGDFDISSVLEQFKTSRDTQRAAGTWTYTAPEAFPRFVDDYATGKRGRVTRSADYYSLGVTIVELLLGTTTLHQCELPDLFDFYLRGDRVQIPVSVSDHLGLLLRGLLIRDRKNRWGYEEVDRWLNKQTTDEDIRRIREDDQYELSRASKPYPLKGNPVDLPGLADAMFHDAETATEDLMTGDVLLNWIGNLDAKVAREIRRDREQWRRLPEMALFCAVMRCDPARPYFFSEGTEALTARDWSEQASRLIEEGQVRRDAMSSEASLQILELWLRLKADPEPMLADAVAQVRSTTAADVRLEEVAYLFEPEKPYRVAPNVEANSPEEIVKLTYGQPDEWGDVVPLVYEESFRRWCDGFLAAWLRQRRLAQLASQTEQCAKEYADIPYAGFERTLRKLDSSLSPVGVRLNLSGITGGCSVPFGTQADFSLPYVSEGGGIPFGRWELHDALPGLQLVDHALHGRAGVVRFAIDSRHDIPASKPFQATLTLNSDIAALVNPPAKIDYKVTLPFTNTLLRIAAGSALGAALLGTPRLVMQYAAQPQALNFSRFDISSVWRETMEGRFPLSADLLGVAILGGCLYSGYRIWLQVLKKHTES